MKYRLNYDGTYYSVQEEIQTGWWIFKDSMWITVECCWDFEGAAKKFKEITGEEYSYMKH
jgi:hypothetical protein